MTPLLLAIPLALAAPVPKDFKPEVPPLDGAWRLTAVTVNGRAAGGNLNAVWQFAGDTMIIEYPDRSTSVPRQIKTDRKVSPMHFAYATEGAQPGIYEIKGETLRIAWSIDGKTRPATTAGADSVLYTLTRVK